VPELRRVIGASAVRLLAAPSVLDALEPPDGVGQGRVAHDEVLWLSDPGRAAELVEAAESAVAADEAALVVDHSDGYAVFALLGDGAREAFSRVSSIRLPQTGFCQGKVAQVPGRVFVGPDRIDLVCGADVAWFVHHRLLEAGRGAGLAEVTA
jgi:Aminomethyltransferase folate-binding domain